MNAILKPIPVPWSVSPSMSGVTLIHSETYVAPECTVILGANRMSTEGHLESCRVDIAFSLSYFAKVGPHNDSESIESIGYTVKDQYEGGAASYIEWRNRAWRASGKCLDSGFYVAEHSEWIMTLPPFFHRDFRHYVIDGRDGYVELIARRFSWKAWLWSSGNRDEAPMKGPVLDSGEEIA